MAKLVWRKYLCLGVPVCHSCYSEAWIPGGREAMVLQHRSLLERVEGRSWKLGGVVVLWPRPALGAEKDGCRCRDCEWVKELASCFPELHRCVGGSLCDVPVIVNTVADVLRCDCCNHEGEDKSRVEGFGDEPCCKHGSTLSCAEGKCVLHGSSLFFSMI